MVPFLLHINLHVTCDTDMYQRNDHVPIAMLWIAKTVVCLNLTSNDIVKCEPYKKRFCVTLRIPFPYISWVTDCCSESHAIYYSNYDRADEIALIM